MIKKFSGLILYLLITLFIITIYLDQPTLFQKFETSVFDKLFQLRGKNQVSDDIQIIAIDDASLKEYGPWPWHRDKIADLVAKVSQQQPKVIFLNLAFPNDQQEDSLGNTKVLANQIKQAGNVILPFRYSTSDFNSSGLGTPDYLNRFAYARFNDKTKLESQPPLIAGSLGLPSKDIAEAACGLGFGGVSFDYDRHVRHEPMILGYAGEYLPSAPLVVAMQFLNIDKSGVQVDVGNAINLGPRKLPTDHSGRMPVNFNGPPGIFKRLAAADILSGSTGKRDLTGKIAIIAFTASSSSDLYSTPVSSNMPGVEITANALENIIHDHFLNEVGSSNLANLLLFAAIGLFSAFILPRISQLYRVVVLGILAFVMVNIGFILFTSLDMITKVSYPVIMIIFFMIASPMLKSQKDSDADDDDDDDEEINYEQLLNATPIGGMKAASRISSGNTGTIATMPARQGGGSSSKTISVAAQYNTAVAESGNFGRYQVIGPIGRGAMGMVYRGLDPAIDRPVALKTIRLDNIVDASDAVELRERLTREAKAAGSLSHPNIVTIYDVGEQDSLQYIAMEFLDGETLEDLLKAGQRWDYKTICKIIIQVCEALDFAHEHGIVHRDIKPANIMIIESDKVKVMDFGIARFDSSNMTQSGVALGTPNYISPEQLKGQPVDRRSDIFSLGVVFYELLTAEKPFKGDTISALIYSILHTSPPPPTEINLDVPRIFDKIITKSLVKDPNMRFQTAREMADILRKLI